IRAHPHSAQGRRLLGGRNAARYQKDARQRDASEAGAELRLLRLSGNGGQETPRLRAQKNFIVKTGSLWYTRSMKSFTDKVHDNARKIPKGKTMTYKEVATKAGNPKAARAVGAVMRTNYLEDVPCHRVVKSDGSFGSYNRGGTLRKQAILKAE